MNVVVAGSDFLRELTVLARIVPDKTTLPILSNVLLQANDGWIHMSCTDLEVSLVTACQANVIEPGEVTLPVSKLTELVKTFSNSDITFINDNRGHIRCTSGGFNSRLQGLPSQDFPSIPLLEGQVTVLPRGPMRDLLKRVRFAINETDTKHIVRGALLTLPEGAFGLVATDSHRLSLSPALRTGPAADPMLLPVKALDHLSNLLGKGGEGDFNLAQTDRHMFFDIDGRLLVSRRIEGKFPNYERIIPRANTHIIPLERLPLLIMLKRQLLIADVVTFLIDAGVVDITTSSAEVGDAIERLPTAYDGPKVQFKVNGQYVIDFLEAASGASINMALKDDKTPMLLTDGDYMNVVMGMRA